MPGFRHLLAGAAGIEPANHGIKTRCLTAWLRPISALLQHIGTRPLDATTQVDNSRSELMRMPNYKGGKSGLYGF